MDIIIASTEKIQNDIDFLEEKLKEHPEDEAIIKAQLQMHQRYIQGYLSPEFYKGMSFSAAIVLLKAGHRMARKGWNGKGMWISMSPGRNLTTRREGVWEDNIMRAAQENGGTIEFLPYLSMKTADNKILTGWLASQTDLLADDWEIVE